MKTFARKNPAKRCADCERCHFDPGRYCGVREHQRCKVCGHCQGRHDEQRNRPERFAGSMAEDYQQRHGDNRLAQSGVHDPTCRWLCYVLAGTRCELVHTCWCEQTP